MRCACYLYNKDTTIEDVLGGGLEIAQIAHISKTTQIVHRVKGAAEIVHRAQIVELGVGQVAEGRIDIHSRHVHEVHVHIVVGEGLVDVTLLFDVDIPGQ